MNVLVAAVEAGGTLKCKNKIRKIRLEQALRMRD
jgi:hypothetical protein